MEKLKQVVEQSENFLKVYYSGLPEEQVSLLLFGDGYSEDFEILYDYIDELSDDISSHELISKVIQDYLPIWKDIVADNEDDEESSNE